MSSKQFRADEIAYDNSGTGLVSTNVQEALDDVASMAQAHDERMANAVIVCRYATASHTLPSTGAIQIFPHAFTVNECGGTLPDASYVGALTRYKVCNNVVGVDVKNVGEPDGPGVVVHMWGGCTGAFELGAIFYKAK